MFDPIVGLDDPIHGDRFVTLADWWWNDRPVEVRSANGEITTRLQDYMPSEMDSKSGIIFCKTDYIPQLFDRLRNACGKYVLITHNSDHNIDEERYAMKPDNVIGWFAQNVVVSRGRLIGIPIGIERPGIAGSGNIEDFKWAHAQKITKTKLAYVNWSDQTNPIRSELKASLRGYEWATVRDERLPFREYLREVSEHEFVISPPGNGDDCHRTWEALYCGSIPILLPWRDGPTIPALYSEGMLLEDINKARSKVSTLCIDRIGFAWWANMIRWYAKGWLEAEHENEN